MSEAVHPYIRNMELLIGPLPEWKGGGDQDQALRIFSDGSQDTLRVRFDVRKEMPSTATPSIISIYNLGPKYRAMLNQIDAQIVLNVGWENTGMVQIFRGSLLAATHYREGASIVTKILSLAAYDSMIRTVVAVSFVGGTSIKEIVTGLAKMLPSVSVDEKLILLDERTVGSQGKSFTPMPVNEALDQMARIYGFSWWVDKGVFHALQDGQVFPSGMVLISSDNGLLMRAEPMLCAPFQKEMGVSIQSLLQPKIDIGRKVRLESNINPQLNNDYVVHILSHTGDSHGGNYSTFIESFLIGGV